MEAANNIQKFTPREILNELVKSWIKEGNGRPKIIKKLEKLGFKWVDAANLHDEIKYSMPEYKAEKVAWQIFYIILIPILIYFLLIIGGWIIGVLDTGVNFVKDSPFGWIFSLRGILLPLGLIWIASLFKN